MSIRGIDTQIMITRATELAKDASAILKHPEVTQTTLAERNKAQSVQDQSRVLATEHTEMEGIRTDADSENANTGGGEGKKEEEEEMTPEQEKELLVAPAAYDQIIDITI